MSQGNYEGISIREAMEKINAKNNGWFLPNIQRQYVWGNRESSEEYICLLVDSLMRGFPIGGLVLWETDEPVPYREFLTDYEVGAVAKIVSKEKWGNHKFLVYDGQQRLQTLHSILYHRFNGRVLYYNLLFNPAENEIDETGFFFKNQDEETKDTVIALPELTGKSTSEEKIQIRRRITKNDSLSDIELNLIETNFDRLWSVFVGTELRSIAYFPVRSNTPQAVNEVFRRLNTGGISLTQLEIVLGKIKGQSPYFEESLWDLTNEIKLATGTPGYSFSAHEIVQLIYLLVFQTTRVDESRVNTGNVNDLVDMLEWVQTVLPYFFKYFFFEAFRINANWLILRQQAILPILAYFVTLARNGHAWKPEKIDVSRIRTYFIKSQLCDWNTPTMVTQFSRQVIECATQNMPFPLDEITQIAIEKNRTGEVCFYQLEGPLWFSLKILTPGREYLFNERSPQIDHIFPKAMHDDAPDANEYRDTVDVLWNMQPTPAGVNNHKRCKHPITFFNSPAGTPFVKSYDFLPELNSKEWENEKNFIAYRKAQMIAFMKKAYDIEIKENPQVE